jgi:aspartate ammonia-lyase
MTKLGAARANFETGGFSQEILTAIEGACNEIIAGKLHDEFRLDVYQGGAGTSTNMNANEVIANRALELMGHKKGEYKYCDPHDHVNRSQSTNDSYPTAMHIGMALGNAEVIAWFT